MVGQVTGWPGGWVARFTLTCIQMHIPFIQIHPDAFIQIHPDAWLAVSSSIGISSSGFALAPLAPLAPLKP